MQIKLGDLKGNTVFTHEGRQWKKTGSWWGAPPYASDGVLEENIGKPHSKAIPKYGGEFQDSLPTFLLDELVVSVE